MDKVNFETYLEDFKGNAIAAYRNAKLGTRLLVGCVFSLNLLYKLFGIPFGARVTRLFPPRFNPWVILTAGYYEPRLVECLLDSYFIYKQVNTLESYWDVREIVKFSAIVSVGATLPILFFLFVFGVLTRNVYLLTQTDIHGLGALLAGCAVALRQLLGENYVTFFKEVGIVANFLPHAVLGYYLFFAVLRGDVLSFMFAFLGAFVAWVYLRYFQNITGRRGDSRKEFAFVSFFPERAKPFVNVVSIYVSEFVAKHISYVNFNDENAVYAEAMERGISTLDSPHGVTSV